MYGFKQIFKFNKIITFFQIAILSLLFVLLSVPTSNISNCKNSLTESSFVQSGYTNGLRETNSYYCEMQWIDLKHENNLIFATCLMTDENVVYQNNYLTKYSGKEIQNSVLSPQECSISKKTASSYKLAVGDIIHTRQGSNEHSFAIKYIFDDYFGLHHFNEFSPECLIILGFNKGILDNLTSKKIYTFSDEVTTFASEPVLDKDFSIRRLDGKLTVYCLIFLGVCVGLTTLLELLFTGRLKSDLIASSKYGYLRKELVFYIAVDSLYKYILYGTISALIGCVVSLMIKTFSLNVLFMAFGVNIVCFILSFVFQLIKNKTVL